VDGAIAEYRRAISLDPGNVSALNNLGIELFQKKDVAGAIAELRKAINLDPNYVIAHRNLGDALFANGDLYETITEYRRAIDLDPDHADDHFKLGNALREKGELAGAGAEYRRAIDIDPRYANAHTNLGFILAKQNDVDGAIAEFRKAIDLEPKDADAHYNLGKLLGDKKGDSDEAIAEYRKAIEINPDYAQAHCNLGFLLRQRGRFEESLEEMRRGHALGSQLPGWPYRSADWVREAEHLVDLERKFPDILSGRAEPAGAAERVALGRFIARYKNKYAAAAALYAGAFAADFKLAADLQEQHRYSAACSATRAAAGQGEDAGNLPDKAQRMLRRQALGWLRDDLTQYAQLAERDDPAAKQFVRQRLARWQKDTDLASVRDRPALDQLPGDERPAWRQLWDDVAALLKKVEDKK
jgi:Tfp pilus assembly protein PilF